MNRNRKPASEISDRAKRYRANTDIPEGLKLCVFCGSSQNLGVDHIDGYEEHGEPENLMWLCKSCNGQKAAVFKAAGMGRATNQYNPFRGLFKGLFGPRETYRRHGPAHLEERARRAREEGERKAAERRAYVEERKREREEKGRLSARYKGVSIYRRGSGEYYTSLDPDSEFESVRDAKKVIDHFRNPATSVSEWSRAVDVLRGYLPGSARQAARVVRSTSPARRSFFLGRLARRNPGAKTMGAFVNALQIWKGKVPGDRAAAGRLIADTPKGRRSEFQREIWDIRKERYGPSGRQGIFSYDDTVSF